MEIAPQLSVKALLDTKTVTIWDVGCLGDCQSRSAEECASLTYLVFPYRGVYVRHVGSEDAVADATQVLFFNESESYCVSHPVAGGDASTVVAIDMQLLDELVPPEHLLPGGL